MIATKHAERRRAAPRWTEHAVWWHIYPLGFLAAGQSAGSSPGRTLDAITDWLGYAADLGVSGLALGPIFASSTHGYDTIDYFRVDDRLGGEQGFDRLLAAASSRGLRVLLDGVFNHVGAGYPQFRRTVAGLATPREANWFVPLAPGAKGGRARPIGPSKAMRG